MYAVHCWGCVQQGKPLLLRPELVPAELQHSPRDSLLAFFGFRNCGAQLLKSLIIFPLQGLDLADLHGLVEQALVVREGCDEGVGGCDPAQEIFGLAHRNQQAENGTRKYDVGGQTPNETGSEEAGN